MLIHPDRERPEKILVAMYKLANGPSAFLKYEDIVVKAFEMFPNEFALRGYPNFPDASDVHKPLYGTLKKKGLVKSADKQFALTARGSQVAQALLERSGETIRSKSNAERIDRVSENEVERMLKAEAFSFFVDGKKERILDIDFFAFIGCTMRTHHLTFQGRMHVCQAAIDAAVKFGWPDSANAQLLSALMKFLRSKFHQEIALMKGRRNA
jgi:hypothetical protein